MRDEPPKMHARVFVVALDADDEPFVTTAHFNGFDKRGPISLAREGALHQRAVGAHAAAAWGLTFW